MAIKWFLCLFGMFLLVPVNYAAPITSSEELAGGLIKAVAERFYLIGLAAQEFMKFFDEIIHKGPTIIEEVLKDPKVLAIKSVDMDNNLNELRKLVKNNENSKKGKDFDQEFLKEITEIFDKYDDEKQELNAEATIIENSLKEHGLAELEKSLLSHFEKFFKTFNEQTEEYIAGLNRTERENEKEFIDWLAILKAEQNTKKKIEIFGKIFEDLE